MDSATRYCSAAGLWTPVERREAMRRHVSRHEGALGAGVRWWGYCNVCLSRLRGDARAPSPEIRSLLRSSSELFTWTPQHHDGLEKTAASPPPHKGTLGLSNHVERAGHCCL